MISGDGLATTAILGVATGAISLTIANAAVTKPIRSFIATRNQWLGKLVSCSYCTSHWVAAGLVAWVRPHPIRSGVIVDLVVAVFGCVAIASITAGGIYHAIKGIRQRD